MLDYEIYEDEYLDTDWLEAADLIPLPTAEDLAEAWWEG